MKAALRRFVVAFAAFAALMLAAAAIARADPSEERARGHGAIGTFEDFNFSARGDPFNFGALGNIKVTFPSSDPNQQFSGDIDCLNYVSPNRVVMSGPLTRVQPQTPFSTPDRFVATATDNGPRGGMSTNPDRFGFQPFESSPFFRPDCINAGFFLFDLPITEGDIDITPGTVVSPNAVGP
jgi:hypothetical protein